MLNWYYKIWADAIVSQRAKKAENTSWKLYTLIPISVLMGINLFTFFYWMKIIVNRNLPLFMPVDIFSERSLNSFISVLITFFIPFVILNYLVIFVNDRYNYVTGKYPAAGGKLYSRYVIYSLGIFMVPVIVRVMFFGGGL